MDAAAVELLAIFIGQGALYQFVLGRIERQVEVLREIALRPPSYRAVEAGDAELRASLDSLAKDGAALTELGLRPLGELVETHAGIGAGAARWFADADGVTFGWLARPVKIKGVSSPRFLRPALTLISIAEVGAIITSRSPSSVARSPAIVRPPFVVYEQRSGSLADAVEAHRARVAGVHAPFVRVATLDDAVREVTAHKRRTIAWREAQPQDALLTEDVRAVLGSHHPAAQILWGWAVRRRLERARRATARVT